ncbi:MAG: LysM peptidoglycan-binding domain-containing protein [Thermaurantimonas sp.]|uniref:LysM peptidoglycan-binding domain-containing protein n=1 Tax=Thermaurantimonas sp. TaxID=2681568 RepID=UPI003918A9DC
MSDSALALAALLTGLQENYLDKIEQAGAAKLSVFQGLMCGFRIDSYIDERFNLYESLLCLQHWMRLLRWDIQSQLQQNSPDNPLAMWKQVFNLLILYFQSIVPADKFQLNSSYTVVKHGFDVSLGQWIVSRNDIRLTQSLNPALRTEVVPKNYPIKISSKINEFNEPKPWAAYMSKIPFEQEKSPRKMYYTVRKGDTLTSIARRFGTSVQAIKAENHLKSDLIAPGQRIVIPAEK